MSTEPFLKIWEHEVFRLLLNEKRITEEVVKQMRAWKHSGFHTRVFSVHKEVFLPANDLQGIENVAQYISRCLFSLARIISVAPDGGVVYKADHNEWKLFPHWKAIPKLPGMVRNFEVFKPLDFLAQGARRDDRSATLRASTYRIADSISSGTTAATRTRAAA